MSTNCREQVKIPVHMNVQISPGYVPLLKRTQPSAVPLTANNATLIFLLVHTFSQVRVFLIIHAVL